MKTVGAFVVGAALLVVIAFGAMYAIPGGWGKPTATVKFVVSNRDQDRVLTEAELDHKVSNELEYIISDELLSDALQRPRAKDTSWYRAQPSAETALAKLKRALQTRRIEGTTCIELSLSVSPGGDALTLLQECADNYLNRKKLMADQQSSHLRRLYLSEGSRAGEDVRALQKQINRFMEENDWLPVDTLSVPYIELQRRHLDVLIELETLKSEYHQWVALDQSATAETDSSTQDATETDQAEPVTLEFEAGSNALQLADLKLRIERQTDVLSAMQPQLEKLESKLIRRLQQKQALDELRRDLEVVKAKQQRFDSLLDDLRFRSNRGDYVGIEKLSDPELE